MLIKEYLKLTRLFNMGLTGIAPVLGALSMGTINLIPLHSLIILFLIGCFSHIYGFVLNDVIDTDVDKLSKELTTRPLISGTITRKNAIIFAITCMVLSWLFTLFFYKNLVEFVVILSILIFADVLSTIYNIASKKYPGMDIFVASAVFFLIIFGASVVSYKDLSSNVLVWIVAFIGAIQVLFMNMINGAIKDVDHDVKGNANTLAIRLGAKVQKDKFVLPTSFKILGYLIESSRSFLIFLPFLILPEIFIVIYWQIILLIVLTILTFYLIYRLFSIEKFQRNAVRKNIGMMVIVMYATAPVMLCSINPYIILLVFVQPIWFIFANLILHKTVLIPKTM